MIVSKTLVFFFLWNFNLVAPPFHLKSTPKPGTIIEPGKPSLDSLFYSIKILKLVKSEWTYTIIRWKFSRLDIILFRDRGRAGRAQGSNIKSRYVCHSFTKKKHVQDVPHVEYRCIILLHFVSKDYILEATFAFLIHTSQNGLDFRQQLYRDVMRGF
jgi:hypothetical protein